VILCHKLQCNFDQTDIEYVPETNFNRFQIINNGETRCLATIDLNYKIIAYITRESPTSIIKQICKFAFQYYKRKRRNPNGSDTPYALTTRHITVLECSESSALENVFAFNS
jgi:phage-related protein